MNGFLSADFLGVEFALPHPIGKLEFVVLNVRNYWNIPTETYVFLMPDIQEICHEKNQHDALWKLFETYVKVPTYNELLVEYFKSPVLTRSSCGKK